METLKQIENKVRGAYVTLNTLKNYGEQVPNDVELLEQFKEDLINSLDEILPTLEEVFFNHVDEIRQSLSGDEVM